MHSDEFGDFLDSYEKFVTRLKPDSRKHKIKSPRKSDNDDKEYETIEMIRKQLYGPGGPYENRMVNPTESFESLQAKRKRGQNEEETIFSQQPTKISKHGSSDFKHLELDLTLSDLKSVNMQTNSSTNSPKHQHKSPCKPKNDHAHSEAIAMILQQLYGSGGLYEHSEIGQSESKLYCSETLQAKRKICQNDQEKEKEITLHEQPAEIPNLSFSVYEHHPESSRSVATADRKPVGTQLVPCSSTALLDSQCKPSCKSNAEDKNRKTTVKILQHLQSSNETRMINQTESEIDWNSCRNNCIDKEQSTFGQKPVNKPIFCFSDLEHISESTLMGNVANNKQANTQAITSISKESCKHQFKSSRRYDNDDNNHENITMIRQQLYSLGGPYENLMVNQTESG